jgi:hypothetical protein
VSLGAYRYPALRPAAIGQGVFVALALSAALARGWLASRGVWWPARMWFD